MYVLCRIELFVISDPLERGICEEIVVANLVVLGGGVSTCAGCFGYPAWRNGHSYGYRHSYSYSKPHRHSYG